LDLKKHIIEKTVTPVFALTAFIAVALFSQYMNYVKLNLLEWVAWIGLVAGSLFVIRKHARLGLRKIHHDLHHDDSGDWVSKPGEGYEAEQEKMDETCLYLGGVMLFFSGMLSLFVKLT